MTEVTGFLTMAVTMEAIMGLPTVTLSIANSQNQEPLVNLLKDTTGMKAEITDITDTITTNILLMVTETMIIETMIDGVITTHLEEVITYHTDDLSMSTYNRDV